MSKNSESPDSWWSATIGIVLAIIAFHTFPLILGGGWVLWNWIVQHSWSEVWLQIVLISIAICISVPFSLLVIMGPAFLVEWCLNRFGQNDRNSRHR